MNEMANTATSRMLSSPIPLPRDSCLGSSLPLAIFPTSPDSRKDTAEAMRTLRRVFWIVKKVARHAGLKAFGGVLLLRLGSPDRGEAEKSAGNRPLK